MIIQKFYLINYNSMEKIKFIIYLTIIFFVNIVFSQDYKLGKVTLDELKQDRCAMDTSAVAEYIFSKGKTYIEYSQTDGFKIITEVENKIKIYKKEGDRKSTRLNSSHIT